MKDLPFVAKQMPDDERFTEALEDFLLGYGHNTARAYCGDLQDVYIWANERDLDFFNLGDEHLIKYVARLRRRHYSESTIRRRMTAWRQLKRHWH